MRVVQVSVFQDPQRRNPDELFEAWPTLAAVAEAVREAGVEVSVVQAAHRDAQVERGGVQFQFVGGPQPGGFRRRAGFWAQPTNERVVDAVQDAKPDVIHFQSLSFPRDVRALCRGTPYRSSTDAAATGLAARTMAASVQICCRTLMGNASMGSSPSLSKRARDRVPQLAIAIQLAAANRCEERLE